MQAKRDARKEKERKRKEEERAKRRAAADFEAEGAKFGLNFREI